MVNSQTSKDFEQVVEKIVFDEEELGQLKNVIKNFSEGNIEAKQLKQRLLECRNRMVKDISHFLSFCIDRIRNEDHTIDDKKPAIENQFNQADIQLRNDLAEKNEFLDIVAHRVQQIVSNLKKKN